MPSDRREGAETSLLRHITPAHLTSLAIYAGVAVLATTAFADPDLWGHVLFGRDIVAGWSIPRLDTYSFTSDREWINHEWLAEVLMYGAFRLGGATGLVVLKTALVLVTLALVSRVVRVAGARGVAHDLVVLLAASGTLPRMGSVRPQLFSVLLFAVLLAVLVDVDRGRRRSLVLLPAVFMLWVNLHGGWIVGLGVLILWGVGRLVGSMLTIRSVLVITATIGGTFLATIANPYGAGLWSFLWQTVGLGRPHIGDWQPLWTNPALFLPFGLSLGFGVAAIWRRSVKRGVAYWLVPALLGIVSLSISRLDAFFSLSVLMLLGPPLARDLAERSASKGPGGVPSVAVALTAATLIVLCAVVPSAILTAGNLACIPMEHFSIPEAEAGRFVRSNKLTGRMLTWYDYGEYAAWHFAPGIRVSMDGRRETVYGANIVADHMAAYFDETGAAAYAQALGVDYVWFARRLPGVADLERHGWVPIFRGDRSIILVKAPGAFFQPGPATIARRCFPGP